MKMITEGATVCTYTTTLTNLWVQILDNRIVDHGKAFLGFAYGQAVKYFYSRGF